MLKRLRIWFRALFNRAAAESDLADELRFHLEQQTQLYVRQGLALDEAKRRARLDFGSVDDVKERHRDQRGTRGIEDYTADLRYAVRGLWRDRALAIAGVLTFALGIGATTAVFSAVNAVMLRDLPFRDPERLVAVWEENPDRGWHKNSVAPANYLDWRAQVTAFEGAAGYTDYQTTVTLLGQGEPQLLAATYVTGNFLSVMGVTPLLGQSFGEGDDWDSGQRPMILSHRTWRNQFRADSAIIGKSVSLGGRRPWQVVGVLPEGFAFPEPSTDVYLPMLWPRADREAVYFRRAHWMRVVARLKPGVSPQAANTSLQTVAKRLEEQYPATNTRMGAGITPLHDWIVGDTRRPLIVLLAAAGVLLLIACANVGNLLLVHALGRARDVALRFALGATRARVARQALLESLVLSFMGGAAGLLLGWLGARALLAMQPKGLLPVSDVAVDYRVLAFATALAVVSGLLFGTIPALNATRQAPAEALSAGGRTFTGSRVRRWGRYLVVAEVALTAMLTVGAGLLVRSYDRLSKVDPGFDPNGVLTTKLELPGSRYDSATKVISFYASLLDRALALPGVEGAAVVRELPVTFASWSSNMAVAGRAPMEQSVDILHREVLGDYFRVMRVRLLRGRTFTAADAPDAPPVVIINETLAKQYFPNEDPIGQRITFDRVPDSTSFWRTIVGVVADERQASLAQPSQPEIFAPFAQDPSPRMTLVVRTRSGTDPVTLAGPVRLAVRGLDSLLALTSNRPMTEVHGEAMSRERFTSALVLVFAVTGLALALVGVFGVLAQLVQARFREMGIRLALGAQRADVRWLIIRHGTALLVIGIGSGLLIALGATRVLDALLYEVQPTDALTYVAVGFLIFVVGTLASLIPALRAGAADPSHTLRAE
ncbi:MAG TPA: ABC transporter permease [Gemmatimonadaceae bacterium]|nr:ABC transporter permease [Gemmatimonadaceae bacterium]